MWVTWKLELTEYLLGIKNKLIKTKLEAMLEDMYKCIKSG